MSSRRDGGRASSGSWLEPRFVRPVLGALALILPISILAVVAALAFSPAQERVTVTFFVFLIGVIGLQTFSGNSGILSFGHAAFMGIGAYVAGILTLSPVLKDLQLPALPGFLLRAELGLPLAIVTTAVIVGIVAYLAGLPITLLGGASGAIATLAFLVIVNVVLVGAKDYTGGAQTFYGLTAKASLFATLGWTSLAILVARLFRDGMPGLQLRASREDELAASSMGVNVRARRLQGWLVSGVLAGISGALLGHLLAAFSPKEFYFILTFSLLAMLILGGMTTVGGAVGGAAIVTLATEFLRRLEEGPVIAGVDLPQIFGLTDIALSVAILAILFFRPRGLFGTRELDELVVSRLARRGVGRPGPGAGPKARAGPSDEPAGQERERPESLLEVRGVSIRFGGLQALRGVDLQLKRGEIVGLIGPNGSGKTTLLNVISGVLPPSEGNVVLDGADITGFPAHRTARQGIARTFQNIRLFEALTVLENIEVGISGRPGRTRGLERRAREILEELDLAALAHRAAGTLPYGEQRRVEIARALAMEPRFLLLDEPAAGMNEAEADELLVALAGIRSEHGLGLLVVEHKLRLIMGLCQRVAVLDEGRVVTLDEPEKVQRHPEVVKAYLGASKAEAGQAKGGDS